MDWQFAVPPDGFAALGFDSDGNREDVHIELPVAVLSVAMGAKNLTEARNLGRARLRSLIGYLRLRTTLVIGARIAWEGPASRTPRGTIQLGSGATQVSMHITEEGIDLLRDVMGKLDLGALEQRHRLALEWLAEAWQAESTPLKLVNLWFSVVTTVDATYSAARRRATTQMERVREYLLLLPVSTSRREELGARLESAYRLRNRIVHDGDRDCVSQESLQALYDAVSEFLLVDLHRSR